MRLVRIPGWEQRFAEFVQAQYDKPFDRGTFDCVRFTADAMFTLVAYDLAQDFRHKYKTDKEAIELVRSFGPDGFLRVCDEILTSAGFTRTDWRHAHRGDPCFIAEQENSMGGGLGICTGPYLVTPFKKGLKSIPMKYAQTVWSIPYV